MVNESKIFSRMNSVILNCFADAKRTFAEDIQNLQSALDDAERTLKERCLNHIPRSLDTLETLVIEHKEFETQLQVCSFL
jgi:hypothetical protein